MRVRLIAVLPGETKYPLSRFSADFLAAVECAIDRTDRHVRKPGELSHANPVPARTSRQRITLVHVRQLS